MPNLPSQKDCCACAACIDVCPKGALYLEEDKRCYYSIKLDSDKCVECKLCEKQCHILHPERLHKSDPLTVKPLAAWSTTEGLIKHSATGAIFAQVAYNMLQNDNVYVYGASLQADDTVKHIEIKSSAEIYKLQNSKYQQSVCSGIYKLAKSRLQEGALVLFSGVPCQIAALYSYLGNNASLTRNLYTIEVLCHGVPCNDIHRTSLKVNKASHIFAYRNKDGIGWCGKNGNNSRLSYILENGDRIIIKDFEKDSLFRSYLTYNYARENCYKCPYADIHRVADLTLGDFWGYEKTPNPSKYENFWGTSIVLPNTAKGLEMIDGDNIIRVDTTWREFLPINQNLYMPTNVNDYKGANLIPFVKRLPVRIKNVIYQGGFFNHYLNRVTTIGLAILFRVHRLKARKLRAKKAEDTLKYLEG